MRIKDYLRKLDALGKERLQLSAAMQSADCTAESRAYKALNAEYDAVVAEREAILEKWVDDEVEEYDPAEDDE